VSTYLRASGNNSGVILVNFALGQTVGCKHGSGEITYLEDGLMEVTLTTGVEKNFREPFLGKVWLYDESVKQISDSSIWQRIAANPSVIDHMNGAKSYHLLIGGLLTRLGGGAGRWDNMSACQKVNVLAVYSGIPVDFIKQAAETDSLAKLFAGRPVGEFMPGKPEHRTQSRC
jgi:hypothetical protein